MAINNSFKNITESLGATNEISCPACGETVNMPIFRSYDLINVIAIIKKEDTQLGIAVCPKCAAAFRVNENYINAVVNGQTVFLTPDDLTRADKVEE